MLQAGQGRSTGAAASVDPRRVDITPPPAPKAAPSQLESAVRGTVQGVTAGFSDEAAGAGGAAINALIQFAGSKKTNESFGDAYTRIRDSERAANADAKDANPGTYATTQIIGTLVPALVTGGTGAGVMGLAKAGALIGAGNSDADTMGGVATDAALGAGTNVIGGKILQGAGSLASTAMNKMGTRALDAATTPGAKAAPGIVDGAVQGVKQAFNPLKADGDVDWGKVGGAATAAVTNPVGAAVGIAGTAAGAGAAKAAIGKAAISNVNAGGTGQVGDAIAASPVGTAARGAANAITPNAAVSDSGKAAGDSVIDFVKNTFGLNTPAGQQNMPDDLKVKISSDEDAVAEGKQNGRPSADVPNIVTEDGKTFLITSSGRRVQLN